MPGILFVCHANRFRSPLAAAFMRQRLVREGQLDWRVESAGTWTEAGLPAHPFVVRYAARFGVDLKRHRSQPVSAELLSGYDLALVMEAGQREALQVEFPEWAGRVCLLSEVVSGLQFDVPDPLGGKENNFEEIAEEVRQAVDGGHRAILARAGALL